MGWSFPWASSVRGEFNYDFHVTIDASVAPVEYNYRDQAELEAADVNWRGWAGEEPGISAFALGDGIDWLAASTLASLQGGLVLTQARRDPRALRQALDGALALIGAYRPSR
jgi:predicted dithiol-disulfide oxidoreductase (DUF899 family)